MTDDLAPVFSIVPKGLPAVRAGDRIELDGREYRVMTVRIREATEDEPELDVKAGDLVTTLELADA